MSDQFFWYVTRSAALVTWLASAASILVGLMTSSRILGRRPTIPWLVDLHRMFAAITMTFLGVHMVSLWLDSFVRFRLDDLLIPWVASVPGLTGSSIAYGVISAWLLLAVQLTSLVKDRMAERLWRSVHLLSFVVLGLGTLHGYQTGSDVDNPIVLGVGVSVLTAVVLATLVRTIRYTQYRSQPVAAPIVQTRPTSPGPAYPEPAYPEPAYPESTYPEPVYPDPANPLLLAPVQAPLVQPERSYEPGYERGYDRPHEQQYEQPHEPAHDRGHERFAPPPAHRPPAQQPPEDWTPGDWDNQPGR